MFRLSFDRETLPSVYPLVVEVGADSSIQEPLTTPQ